MTYVMRFGPMMICAGISVAGGGEFSVAHAREPLRLVWSNETEAGVCPSSEALARAVAAKLGYDPFDDQAQTELHGAIRHHGSAWTVRMAEVKGGKEIFTHESPPVEVEDCVEPHALAVHLVAVAIQTGRVLDSSAIGLAQSPEPSAHESAPNLLSATIKPSSPVIEKKVAPAPPSSNYFVPPRSVTNHSFRHRNFDTHVFLGSALGLGLFPALAPAVAFSAGAGRGRFEVAAGMFLFPEVQHPTEPFRFGLTALTLAGCVRAHRTERMVLLGCGSMWVGAHHVVALDDKNAQGSFETTFPGERAWFEFAVSPRLRFVVAKPFTLQLGADVLFPFQYESVLDMGRPNEKIVASQFPIVVIPQLQLGVTIF